MKVIDLKPFQKKVSLLVKIVKKETPKDVQSRWDSSSHKMAEILVGDETACVLLTLWDESINSIEDGKTYIIENAYTTMFKNSLRLNTGRFGKILPTTQLISTVNTDTKLSQAIEERTEKEITAKTEKITETKTGKKPRKKTGKNIQNIEEQAEALEEEKPAKKPKDTAAQAEALEEELP